MYKELSDDEVVSEINQPPLASFQISRTESLKTEMTRRLLDSNRKLIKSVSELNKSTGYYSKILLGLTTILVILTLVQIYLIFASK